MYKILTEQERTRLMEELGIKKVRYFIEEKEVTSEELKKYFRGTDAPKEKVIA